MRRDSISAVHRVVAAVGRVRLPVPTLFGNLDLLPSDTYVNALLLLYHYHVDRNINCRYWTITTNELHTLYISNQLLLPEQHHNHGSRVVFNGLRKSHEQSHSNQHFCSE